MFDSIFCFNGEVESFSLDAALSLSFFLFSCTTWGVCWLFGCVCQDPKAVNLQCIGKEIMFHFVQSKTKFFLLEFQCKPGVSFTKS